MRLLPPAVAIGVDFARSRCSVGDDSNENTQARMATVV